MISTPSNLGPPSFFDTFQGRRFWLAPLGLMIFFGIYFGSLGLAQSGDLVTAQIISEGGQVVSLVWLVVLCLWASQRASSERVRWAWRLFALAFLTYTAAESTFGFESIVIFQQDTPTPTLADLFYLPFYPLMAAGLLLLPPDPRSQNSRLRAVVDSMIIVGAFLGLALIYLIDPNFSSTEPPLTIGVLVAYPVGDVILVLTLVLLFTRGTQAVYRPILLFLTLGIVSFIYADVAFNFFGLQGSYTVGNLNVDPFWALGELLMSLAPLYYIVHGEHLAESFTWLARVQRTNLGESWLGAIQRSVLPFLSVLVLVVLLFLNVPPIPDGSYFPVLAILTGFMIVLVGARQILIGRDLVDAQTTIEQAQQLDTLKNQFITSINHELRTPLMTMQAYIEVLRLRQDEMAKERRFEIISEVGRTSDALVDLVQSILEIRRLDQETGDFPREAVSVQAAFEQSLALMNPREARVDRTSIRVSIPPGFNVWGDAVRLQQVLTNLISNAIKYSPQGGTIWVAAQVIEPPRSLRRRRNSKELMAEILIRDQGLGIPPEQIPLLFQQFVRLQRDLASNVIGSGLGLYLCRTLTEAMDGMIWVESTGVPGEGSVFHVVLPLAPVKQPKEIESDDETKPRLKAVSPVALREMPRYGGQ